MNESDLTKNYFELFGLPQQFDLEARNLTERYKDLQRQLHPDALPNQDDARQRRVAMQAAAHVNEAYRILHSPLDRAVYLLGLKGYMLGNETAAQLPPEFLMQQIQLREELEIIPGTDSPRECLLELRERIDIEIKMHYQTYLQQMEQQQYRAAGDAVRKLQFFHKLHDEIDEMQFELEDELD